MLSLTRLVLPAAVAASAALLAACGSAAAPVTGAPVHQPPTGIGPVQVPSSAPAVTTPASPATGARPACGGAHLAIAYTANAAIRGGTLAGMSHADNVITFTNTGTTACQTAGYPGVDALNAAGQDVAHAARSGAAYSVIVLQPGQTASAEVTGNTASCRQVTTVGGLLVTAPNQFTSVRLGPDGALCPASLGIGPLHPGNAAGLAV